MSEPVTQTQFFEAFQQLLDKIDVKHASMRQYVGDRADKLEAIARAHSIDDAAQFKAINDRVLVIEIERSGEKAQAVKHGTWAGIVAAATLTSLIEGLKRLLR